MTNEYEINLDYFHPMMVLAGDLAEANVPFTMRTCYDGFQFRFDWCAGDVVCHFGSYSNSEGYVESYKFPFDGDDVSVMKPHDMAAAIIEYYKEL